MPDMSCVDANYIWGITPHFYLNQRDYAKVLILRGLVKDTRAEWDHVPLALRPLAEDMASSTPSWLEQPTTNTIVVPPMPLAVDEHVAFDEASWPC